MSELDDPTNLPLFLDDEDTPPTVLHEQPATSPSHQPPHHLDPGTVHQTQDRTREAAAGSAGRRARRQAPTPSRGPGRRDNRFWAHVSQLRAVASPRLAEDLTTTQRRDPEETRAIIEQVVRDHVSGLIRGEAEPWDEDYAREIKTALFDEFVGLGRLQPLIDHPEVENVAIYGHDKVLLKLASGERVYSEPVALNDEELLAYLQQLADRHGRSFAQGSPVLDLALPGRVRLHATHPHINQGIPIVNLRIHRHADADLAKLRELGELDYVLDQFLAAVVRARKSIVVSGRTQGSGKTTLLRALARAIPTTEKVVTIETEFELYLHEDSDHPEVSAFEAKPSTGEFTPDGRPSGEVTTELLAWASLRENADRVIVGEARSHAEVGALMDVMQHGGGSMATIHADNARTVISRLVDFVGQHTGSYEAAARQVARLFHLIVYIGTDIGADGRKRRYVTEVLEVEWGENGEPIGTPIFSPGPDRRAVPNNTPSFIDDLVEVGFDRELLNHPAGLWNQAEVRS